jgi:2-succinyl-6-hydroxy-2,4-cyclohexadiene-1-carboxylate synthase
VPALLHHIETGSAEAPPLVLLHGFLGSGRDWEPVMSELARDFRCVALDLPGHGNSTGLPAEAYAWDGALESIAATLDALEIQRFRMVGYSMGGRLGIGFALRYPRRAARIVLVGASPGLRGEEERLSRAALDEERAGALASDLPLFVRLWYRMPLFESLSRDMRVREALTAPPTDSRLSRLNNDREEVARALVGLSAGRMPCYWNRLDDLGGPTLAVAGAADSKFVDLAFQMAAAGRPVTPLVIPDAGHLVHLERPHALAEVVRDFFRDALIRPSALRLVSQAA